MKVSLTYFDVFVISSALSELFTQKMSGKVAAKLFKFSRQFKDFVEDYNKGIELIKKDDFDENEYNKQVNEFNNSTYIEVEKLDIKDLEELQIEPVLLVKLEKVLNF